MFTIVFSNHSLCDTEITCFNEHTAQMSAALDSFDFFFCHAKSLADEAMYTIESTENLKQ